MVELNDIEKTILEKMDGELMQQDTTPSCVKTFQRQVTFLKRTRCLSYYLFLTFTFFAPV